MKSWYVDPATSERYLLVSTSGATVMAADQEMLLLRNDQAIMQSLHGKDRSVAMDALKEQLTQTQARLAVLEEQIKSKKKDAA